jgi:hypothetical protein
MVDERKDSIEQGIGVPPESPIGKTAEDARRRKAAESPEIGGGLGGTSDSDSPAQQAQFEAERRADEQEHGSS